MSPIASVELASPSTIALLTDLARTGEIPYDVAAAGDNDEDESAGDPADVETEEIEISEECDRGEHPDCIDEECECECHEGEDEVDIDTDGDDEDLDDEDFEDDDDLEDDGDDDEE